MTVKEIIEAYLKENGYDGLYNSDGNCACRPGDLAPCDSLGLDCKPGYLQPCDGTCDDPPCDWHIGRDKPTSGAGLKVTVENE